MTIRFVSEDGRELSILPDNPIYRELLSLAGTIDSIEREHVDPDQPVISIHRSKIQRIDKFPVDAKGLLRLVREQWRGLGLSPAAFEMLDAAEARGGSILNALDYHGGAMKDARDIAGFLNACAKHLDHPYLFGAQYNVATRERFTGGAKLEEESMNYITQENKRIADERAGVDATDRYLLMALQDGAMRDWPMLGAPKHNAEASAALRYISACMDIATGQLGLSSFDAACVALLLTGSSDVSTIEVDSARRDRVPDVEALLASLRGEYSFDLCGIARMPVSIGVRETNKGADFRERDRIGSYGLKETGHVTFAGEVTQDQLTSLALAGHVAETVTGAPNQRLMAHVWKMIAGVLDLRRASVMMTAKHLFATYSDVAETPIPAEVMNSIRLANFTHGRIARAMNALPKELYENRADLLGGLRLMLRPELFRVQELTDELQQWRIACLLATSQLHEIKMHVEQLAPVAA